MKALSSFLVFLVAVCGRVVVLEGTLRNMSSSAPHLRITGPQSFNVTALTVDMMPFLVTLPDKCSVQRPPSNNTNATAAAEQVLRMLRGRIGIVQGPIQCRDTGLRACQQYGCVGVLIMHSLEGFMPPILNQWGKIWEEYTPFNFTPSVPCTYLVVPRDQAPRGPDISVFLRRIQITNELTDWQDTADSYGVFLQVFHSLLLVATAALAAFVMIQSIRRKLLIGAIVGSVELAVAVIRFSVLAISWNGIHPVFPKCVDHVWLLMWVSPSMCCTMIIAIFWFHTALYPLHRIDWSRLGLVIAAVSLVLLAAEFVRPICECTILFAGFPPLALRLTGLVILMVVYGLACCFFCVSAVLMWRRVREARRLKSTDNASAGSKSTWVLVGCVVACEIGCLIMLALIADVRAGEWDAARAWANQTLLPIFVIGASFFQLLLFWGACYSYTRDNSSKSEPTPTTTPAGSRNSSMHDFSSVSESHSPRSIQESWQKSTTHLVTGKK